MLLKLLIVFTIIKCNLSGFSLDIRWTVLIWILKAIIILTVRMQPLLLLVVTVLLISLVTTSLTYRRRWWYKLVLLLLLILHQLLSCCLSTLHIIHHNPIWRLSATTIWWLTGRCLIIVRGVRTGHVLISCSERRRSTLRAHLDDIWR